MKVLELERGHPTLNEVIHIAGQEPVILRKQSGKLFVVPQVDEFDAEVACLKSNKEFMHFLKELSQENSTSSLGTLREELGLLSTQSA